MPPELASKIDRFYDELISHIILASGPRLERERLAELSLAELCKMCWENGIQLTPTRWRPLRNDPFLGIVDEA